MPLEKETDCWGSEVGERIADFSLYILLYFLIFTYLKINFQLKQTWQNNMRYCSYLKSYSCISEQQTLFGTIILPTDILQQYIHCLKWDVFLKKKNISSPDIAIKFPSYPNSAFASLF